MKSYTVALIGNPNVGKSTLFNKLTGKKQHTGNWAGKTVEIAKSVYKTKEACYHIVDLPGIYSLDFKSPEEKIAKDFLLSKQFDAVIILTDATDLKRNFHLTLQVLKICPKSILCINMMDEAKRRGITIDTAGLSKALSVPVITCSARKNIDSVKEALTHIDELSEKNIILPKKEELIQNYVTYSIDRVAKKERLIDSILCGKYTAVPIMVLFLAVILWITIVGANYPSELLAELLSIIGEKLGGLLLSLNPPMWLYGILIDGAYSVTAQVVSVMLPPMAIFFPLFSLLEESGFLPRIALNLDTPFKKAGSSGKQALTMCMGLGCNAVGVTGCRIIPSDKQQLIAILTNSFMPCNGRFPTIILLIGIMLGHFTTSLLSAVLLTLFILLAVIVTLLITKVLSRILTGENISVIIELPSYKKPPIIKILTESLIHKALHILGRALIVSAPAGIVLWLLGNIHINSSSILILMSEFLEPIGSLLAMDGVILLAFILGIPANEIVLPIAVMIYTASSNMSAVSTEEIKSILLTGGWDFFTALSVALFSLFHWPCATTLLTIKKESNSLKYTLLSLIIPTAIGFILCSCVNLCKLLFISVF